MNTHTHFDCGATFTREDAVLSDLRKQRKQHNAFFRLFTFFLGASIYMAYLSHSHGDIGGTMSYVGASILTATVTLMQWVERTRIDNTIDKLQAKPLDLSLTPLGSQSNQSPIGALPLNDNSEDSHA